MEREDLRNIQREPRLMVELSRSMHKEYRLIQMKYVCGGKSKNISKLVQRYNLTKSTNITDIPHS